MRDKTFEKIKNYIVENQDRSYRLAYSYLKNREDALDAVQDAVCRALEHGGSLHNAEAVKTWFYRILVNECLRLLKERKQQPTEDMEGLDIPYEEKGFEPADDLEHMLGYLDQDTQIIRLRFYEELSIMEISRITGLNLNTVKARLYRGLKKLRINIEEAGI